MTHNSRTKGYLTVMTLAALVQVACTETTNDEEDVGEAEQPVLVSNALVSNALVSNALVSNALVSNALVSNALVSNALVSNALVSNALKDPNARELLKYVTSCALPEDAHFDLEIEGVTYGFDGDLGLAPEWGEEGGSCDDECKSWVSACVIARLDYTGDSFVISLRGKHEALDTPLSEMIKYPVREATYYGDIFASEQKIFACLPMWKQSIPRVCGPSLDDCVVDVQGKCEALCGNMRPDGSYPNCREQGEPKKPWGYKKGEKHVGSITVFLPFP